MMAKIVTHIVTKNEANRYLTLALESAKKYTDEIYIYDDRSTDETVEIAMAYGAHVTIRPDSKISFMQHEGKFRQAGWEAMGNQEGNWIFCLDADEVISGPFPDDDYPLKMFKVREVFDINENGTYMVRTDGYWDQITATRMCMWTSRSEFANKSMASGSLPLHASAGASLLMNRPEIIHLGYARETDREEKHDRYFGLVGHNPRHISSILQSPTLKEI